MTTRICPDTIIPYSSAWSYAFQNVPRGTLSACQWGRDLQCIGGQISDGLTAASDSDVLLRASQVDGDMWFEFVLGATDAVKFVLKTRLDLAEQLGFLRIR